MQPNTRVAARHGPSRLQVALVTVWMIVSLAVGGIVSAGSGTDGGASSTITRTAQP
jgi:hypothetical protein